MNRAEAVRLLHDGATVTHPGIAGIPMKERNGVLFYLHGGKELYAGNSWDFFVAKQTTEWDTGWEICSPEETV
jgi:hypothetical protein